MKLTLVLEHQGYDEDKETNFVTIDGMEEDTNVSRLCAYFAQFLAGAGYVVNDKQKLVEDQ